MIFELIIKICVLEKLVFWGGKGGRGRGVAGRGSRVAGCGRKRPGREC